MKKYLMEYKVYLYQRTSCDAIVDIIYHQNLHFLRGNILVKEKIKYFLFNVYLPHNVMDDGLHRSF